MRYVGGKNRIAKELTSSMLAFTTKRLRFLEPFVGGCNIIPHVVEHFEFVRAGDAHQDLMLMWNAVKNGWVPPENVSEEEYRALKKADPSPMRGFAGFACAFGGDWFHGYARGRGRNDAREGSRKVRRTFPHLAHVELVHCSFDEWEVDASDVVYCDPPYAGVCGYSTGPFDNARFWEVATEWSLRGADVFVSEYQAPTTWTAIWEKPHVVSLGGNRPRPVERLFVHDSTRARCVGTATASNDDFLTKFLCGSR